MNIIKKFKEIVLGEKEPLKNEINYFDILEVYLDVPYLRYYCNIFRDGNCVVVRHFNDEKVGFGRSKSYYRYVLDYNTVYIDKDKDYVDIYVSTPKKGELTDYYKPRISKKQSIEGRDTLIKIRYSFDGGENDIVSCSEQITENEIQKMKETMNGVPYKDRDGSPYQTLNIGLGAKFFVGY